MILIDNIKKFLTKNILIVGLVGLVCIGGYVAYNQHSKLLLTRSDLETVQRLNIYVNKERHRLDSITVVLNKSIKDRDILIAGKDKTILQQSYQLASLKDSLKKVKEKLNFIELEIKKGEK